MIRIIHGKDAAADDPLLQSMFADRKALFVDLMGWDVPVVDSRFEIDQFDDDHAVYLVSTEGADAHAASIRLLPTTRPHMLDSLFPQLCPFGVPVGPTIWESGRLCLPQRHHAVGRRALRDALFRSAVEWAMAQGVDRLTGMVPDRFRRELLAMGWQAEPLGPAVDIAGVAVGAFLIHVGPDTMERLSWTGVSARRDGELLS